MHFFRKFKICITFKKLIFLKNAKIGLMNRCLATSKHQFKKLKKIIEIPYDMLRYNVALQLGSSKKNCLVTRPTRGVSRNVMEIVSWSMCIPQHMEKCCKHCAYAQKCT